MDNFDDFLPGMHVVARNYTRVKSVLCNMFAHFVFIFSVLYSDVKNFFVYLQLKIF